MELSTLDATHVRVSQAHFACERSSLAVDRSNRARPGVFAFVPGPRHGVSAGGAWWPSREETTRNAERTQFLWKLLFILIFESCDVTMMRWSSGHGHGVQPHRTGSIPVPVQKKIIIINNKNNDKNNEIYSVQNNIIRKTQHQVTQTETSDRDLTDRPFTPDHRQSA